MTLAELWKFGVAKLDFWDGYRDGFAGHRPRSGVDAYLTGYRRGQVDSGKGES